MRTLGQYAGVTMSVYGAILPGAARRWRVIQRCEEHGGRVRLTARHFVVSPDTISRWLRAYREGGVAGLEPRSQRPKRVRQPQTLFAVVQRIQALREQYPRWGQEKLKVLPAREGITISAKSIDRVIAGLKARGALREPLRPRKRIRWLHERLRRPPRSWWWTAQALWCKWTASRCRWGTGS